MQAQILLNITAISLQHKHLDMIYHAYTRAYQLGFHLDLYILEGMYCQQGAIPIRKHRWIHEQDAGKIFFWTSE